MYQTTTSSFGFLFIFLSTNLLFFHGTQAIATATSSGQVDSKVHQRLLHLETILELVMKELTAVKQENQLLQQKVHDQQIQKLQQWNQTVQTKIISLENSLKTVQRENKMMKFELDRLNTTLPLLPLDTIPMDKLHNLKSTSILLLKQNAFMKDQLESLNSSFIHSSLDAKRLESTLTEKLSRRVKDGEQEMMNNMSAIIKDLKVQEKNLSLSLSDVKNKMATQLSSILQQQLVQAEQQKLTESKMQNVTQSLLQLHSDRAALAGVTHNVAFTAGIKCCADNTTFSKGEKIIFPEIIYQVGGGYNPKTGVFTAPKTGLYIIFSTIVADNNQKFSTRVMINGSLKAKVIAWFNYQSGSNFVAYRLKARDQVWTEVDDGSHLYSYYLETTFSVVMINRSS
ncbi:uncharacterized protein LOC133191318 [Saccostrea echinata]|uniref:uncharacterized protein LOC133191318 n=1 Tax=Saccostrea echinata TaxID=191078 RepID=UPI002A810F80|nr:uncharacterized protein LOC133191318 [Saccostrea echinata]